MRFRDMFAPVLRPFTVVIALAAALPACASDGEVACDLKCDCEGCSDAMYDSCYAEANSKSVEADRLGCLGFYDDLKACEAATGYCKSNADWETSCKTEKERYDNCKK